MWSKEETKNRKVMFFTNFGIYMKKYIPEYGKKSDGLITEREFILFDLKLKQIKHPLAYVLT